MKKLTFTIYILLCVLLFVGCTNNDEDVTQDQSAAQEKDVTGENNEDVTDINEELEEIHNKSMQYMYENNHNNWTGD